MGDLLKKLAGMDIVIEDKMAEVRNQKGLR